MTRRVPRPLTLIAGVSLTLLAAIAGALLIDLPIDGRDEILWRIRVPRV